MTRREFYTFISNFEAIPVEYQEFAKELIAKMDALNDKRKETPSTKQKENDEFANSVLEKLDRTATYYASDIANLFGIKPQKASAVLKHFVKTGVMTMTFDAKGKRAYTFI